MASVLFIVEGEVAETNFLKHVVNRSVSSQKYECYVFGATIYSLYKTIKDDIKKNLDSDVILTLKEKAIAPEKVKLLEELSKINFTDIYLIFDFDPHVSNYNAKSIIEMSSFFHDSTDMGKLYINYPMIESFRHIKSSPDLDFFDRKIEAHLLKSKNWYKDKVKNESGFQLNSKHSNDTIIYIIFMHLLKAYYLLEGGRENYMTYKMYDKVCLQSLLNYQITLLQNENMVNVINSSLFIAVDYNPTLFFEKYNNYKI